MTPEEKDKLLDRYVTGQPMSVQEESSVERLLDTDTAFETEYKLRRELFELGKRERRATWEARPESRQMPVHTTAFPMRWAAAASIVLLLGIGLAWWLRLPVDQPLTGQAPLFEQHDSHLGLANPDRAPVGTVTWIVTKADENQYEFSQLGTLRIFTPDPQKWQGKTWQLIRLSEVRYQLKVGPQTYTLEQGRSVRLPLEPQE